MLVSINIYDNYILMIFNLINVFINKLLLIKLLYM